MRYGFGKNWKRFLERLTAHKVALAESSLGTLLQTDSLSGKTFLDVGSGSGLFSLAAKSLGAKSIHSFDYDTNSVECTEALRGRYDVDQTKWKVEQGSILDDGYLKTLPQSDVVYSWGVLHHTGEMWQACDNITQLVKPGGQLVIALYNDQGLLSKLWCRIKQLYNLGPLFQLPIIVLVQAYFSVVGLIADLFVYRRSPLKRYTDYGENARGMSRYTDLLDWLGGYPFEVASPEAVLDFFKARNFTLQKMNTVGGGLACNEFVLQSPES